MARGSVGKIRGFVGLKELTRKLKAMRKTEAKKCMRAATRSGTAELAQGVKSEAPGRLKKIVGYKVTNKGYNFKGIVGADVAKLKAESKRTGEKYPTNVDHLVEDGHALEGGGMVAPNPFIRRGFAKSIRSATSKAAASLERSVDAVWRGK